MSNSNIVIIDYGMGNLYSVQYKLKKLFPDVIVSSSAEEIRNASKIILPGVGHFAVGMKNIIEKKLKDVLDYKALEEKIPVLGICLGMQLITNYSEEGNVEGLGWIPGKTIRFEKEKLSGLKIPHMGWNNITIDKNDSILNGLTNDDMFYFVHSYRVICENNEDSLCSTEYGVKFSSGISKGNIYGFQFHPEKSHDSGLKILKNFISI
ncbi:MAG TPA: imidazole glycerol phosphate synthase subunit HisH [Bacteroidales bacterium]|nr:imidazole glycerol phosphate synthase subunit HisH [Bacteroidales bacterium]HPS15941.1 imidazole glycerol phosphate synthase subunit HisH [Bacteroidales bacterium]